MQVAELKQRLGIIIAISETEKNGKLLSFDTRQNRGRRDNRNIIRNRTNENKRVLQQDDKKDNDTRVADGEIVEGFHSLLPLHRRHSRFKCDAEN